MSFLRNGLLLGYAKSYMLFLPILISHISELLSSSDFPALVRSKTDENSYRIRKSWFCSFFFGLSLPLVELGSERRTKIKRFTLLTRGLYCGTKCDLLEQSQVIFNPITVSPILAWRSLRNLLNDSNYDLICLCWLLILCTSLLFRIPATHEYYQEAL